MDSIECEFITKHLNQDCEFNGKLDDQYFVRWINRSSDQLRTYLLFIRSINQNDQNNSTDQHEQYFMMAISSLQVFVLANWIYIKQLELDACIIDLLNQIDHTELKNELQLFNSDYQPNIKYPQLLYIAKKILKNCSNDNLCFLVWKIRYLTVFQCILNRMDSSFDDADLPQLIIRRLESEKIDRRLKMRFFIEICQYNLILNKVQDLRELLINANNCTQLEIRLSGALGKRTQFQQEAKSILFLNLTRQSILENGSNKENDEYDTKLNSSQIDAPRDMNLNDDTLLSKPAFLNDIANEQQIKLSDDEETLLLAIVKFGSKCGVGQDNLLKEELITYLEHLISKSTVWPVIFESMYQRSVFESNERRKVERSMLQLSELIDKINQNSLTAGHTKLHLFYSSPITPIWRIKRKFADILITLACVKEALDIYIELDLWEDIVFCYKQINRRDKAAEIIRQQLEINETPYLLCLLGDATDEIVHYEKAWQLSDGRSYLAQKRLGYHYFDLKDYHKAIECLKKSVELNCNQSDAFQRLGYSALLVEDYELAAAAYRRVVESDLDNFQAWNNLSKAYIKLKDKHRAFRTLQEALKYNNENWKIWENFIVVSVDVGAFNEVVYAWNRLIDIKSKYEDDEIMTILVNQLCATETDSNIENLSSLQKRTLKLLGRMTANFQCSSSLWLLYARLLINVNDMKEKVLDCLSKAQRALVSKSDWEKCAQDVLNNLKLLDQIYEYYQMTLEKISDENARKRYWATFKLSANSMLSLIRNRNEYWSNDELVRDQVQSYLDKLPMKLNDIS